MYWLHFFFFAGSDLDGDEYFVLWDPDLIFHRNNEPPAHFPSKQAPDVPYIDVRSFYDLRILIATFLSIDSSIFVVTPFRSWNHQL